MFTFFGRKTVDWLLNKLFTFEKKKKKQSDDNQTNC